MQTDRRCSARGAAKKSLSLARVRPVGQSHVKKDSGLSQEALERQTCLSVGFRDVYKVEGVAVSPRSVPNCPSRWMPLLTLQLSLCHVLSKDSAVEVQCGTDKGRYPASRVLEGE